MKVMLVNGSPHPHGCTYTALMEIAATLHDEGVETTLIQVGEAPLHSCTSCYKCKTTHRCIFDDIVNRTLDQLDECDGIIIGSPVHYAAASGLATTFCDRLWIAGAPQLAYKPGAAITSARRAGTSSTLDQLNKYFSINNMPVVSSQYWNMVHGNTPDEVAQDVEGRQTMRQLARNMAWLLKCIAAGKQNGIGLPAQEERERTNFIR